jgi:flagellar hook-associated protein 3 FlgL
MISSVSTASMSLSLSNSIADLQKRLSTAQKEVSTGQQADLSLALGSQLSRDNSMHLTVADIDAITASNNVVSSRLGVTQTSLQKLSTDAQAMRSALLTAQGGSSNPSAILQQAKTALAGMISTLNNSDGNSYVFGGVKGDKAPVADFFSTPTSPAKAALDTAFTSYFGFPSTSSQVSTITATQMNAFLSGPAATVLSSANWTVNWSSASSQPQQNRISISQTIDTSVTANDPAFQKLAAGYALLSDLGLDQLSSGAFQAVVSTANGLIDQSVSGLNNLQTTVGVMQSDTQNAVQALASQKDLLSGQIGNMENVDQAQTSVTVNNLMTQLETSYSLTARIQQLSLTKYL